MQPDAICLVSGADEIRYRSYINHAIYARTHGLDYRLECGVAQGVTNKFYYKMAIVERIVDKYDWIVWIDDDCYFTDFARDTLTHLIDEAERDGDFLIIANGPTEPNGFWSTINSGVFALRRGPLAARLLATMETTDVDTVRAQWDTHRDGTFTGGDQDVMTWALRQGDPELWTHTKVVDSRDLNGRPWQYDTSLTDAFICHFAGYPDKKMGVILFAEKFGIGHELVPEPLLDEFSVKVRSPMPTPERTARRAWWVVRPHVKRVVLSAARRVPEHLLPAALRQRVKSR